MAQRPANIDSPEVIRRFRFQLVRFEESCRRSLEETFANARKVEGWLQREVGPYWKQQLRKRQEKVEAARQAYAAATWGRETLGKASVMDERKALSRAIRLREEAEHKVQVVKRCNMLMDSKIGKRLRPCRSLSQQLDTLIPQALVRLDQMLDSLDVYFHRSPPGLEG